MGPGRWHALGGAAVLCCAVACGGGGGGPKSTSLPLQQSGLAVGGDAQSQATDVAQTRLSDRQLRKIAAACRKAVEITDPGSDPCARAIHDVMRHRKKCVPSIACGTMKLAADKKSNPAGFFTVHAPRCGKKPCLLVGVQKKEELFAVAATTPPPEHGPSGDESSTETAGPSGAPTESDTEEAPSGPGPSGGTTHEENPGDGGEPEHNGPGPDTSP
ncbi:hypothetical protein [Actinomadura sp. NEAU-AAG7]|uniref:hypothetical protein n=1 Tax=Actinomadura sp. NEAU-AAG7 TaxID=2839640 RepID=UPI001BE420DC|nr:hypothetical protein [Actinomadura sp. NEAU-AAG7]MBT2213665.1 hypothetical protein [Actinomadura sp. NEAU-AAG7]